MSERQQLPKFLIQLEPELWVVLIKLDPDYNDTAYHSRIAKHGKSRNVDSFMIPDDQSLAVYHKWHGDADVAVVGPL